MRVVNSASGGFVYFLGKNGWRKYNLDTGEFEEGEPPSPKGESVVISKLAEKKIFESIKSET